PVDHDRLAEVADHHVRRLEVAMDDPTIVRVRHRIGDRDHVRQQCEAAGERRLFFEQLLERTPADELHRVERRAVGPAPGSVPRPDPGLLEARGAERLAEDPELRAPAAALQLLDRDVAPELAVVPAQHDAETATALLAEYVVAIALAIPQRRR